MESTNAKEAWERYRSEELSNIVPILRTLGYTLDETQVHTDGERFLMVGERDVGGGGYKLVLIGTEKATGTRVVIKVSSDSAGKREIESERAARETVRTIAFSYQPLHIPQELLYINQGPYRIFITEYIEQDQTFLSRPLPEQFDLVCTALKAQESVHATTYSHARVIRRVFGIWGARDYLASFKKFYVRATSALPEHTQLHTTLERASTYLKEHADTLEQYSGFLTHADFVPHNFRVNDGEVYLLDSASLHFGNKYESWGRLLNFLLLYNRPLEHALADYVKENRTPEENDALTLMRIYKLGTLLNYHASSATKTEGPLHDLSMRRVAFWLAVLEAHLDGAPVSTDLIDDYTRERDALRSSEEKKRQEALH